MPLRSFSAAEMLLTERQRIERPLLILILLSVGSFSLAENQWPYLLLVGIGVSINLAATFRAKEIYAARLFVNIGVAVATLILLGELFVAERREIVSLAHYLILIMLCKLFERKTNRDYAQMVAMSLLLIVAASLTTVELWFGFATVIYLLLLSYIGMIFTLKRGLDAAAGEKLPGEASPLAPQRVAWNVTREWPSGTLRRKMAVVWGGVGIISIGLFLFLPRMAGSSMSMYGAGGSSRETGFTREISLGDPGRLYASDRELLRIRVSGDVAPGQADFWGYLRAQTFEHYTQSRWDEPSRTILAQPPQLEPPKAGVIVQEISADPSLMPNLFAIYPAVALAVDAGLPFDLDRDLNWSLRTQPSSTRWVRYTARSLPGPMNPRQRELLASLGNEYSENSPLVADRIKENQNPASTVDCTPRVYELARQWCSDLLEARRLHPESRDKIDLDIADRISRNLKAKYSYSLDFSDADRSRDGVEDFLFYMKHGHCEYFASAMTVMCRTLGVRARLATGFHIGPENLRNDVYIARGRDAHAWTEVYTPSSDWVIVDATGIASRPIPQAGWQNKLKEFWLSCKTYWADSVVGYDYLSHRDFTQKVASFFMDLWSGLVDWASRIPEALSNLLLYGYIDKVLIHLVIGLAAFTAVLEGILIARWIRLARRAKEVAANLPCRLEFFDALQAMLQKNGASRSENQTYRQQALAASQKLDLPSSVLLKLINLYYRVRWGGQTPSADELGQAQSAVGQLETTLAKRSAQGQ